MSSSRTSCKLYGSGRQRGGKPQPVETLAAIPFVPYVRAPRGEPVRLVLEPEEPVIRVETVIEAPQPPARFVDEMVKGAFAEFQHTHEFEERRSQRFAGSVPPARPTPYDGAARLGQLERNPT